MRRIKKSVRNAGYLRYLYLFALVLFLFSGVAYSSELVIGLIPEQNVFKQLERYKPLGEYIEKKTGINIKFTMLSRYGNIIESFRNNKMDAAFWGSFTGALAVKKLNVEFIARPVNPDGASTYKGYILVRKDSGIKNAADMKGKTIAFVDKATTAGYVFPLAYFKGNGVKNPEGYFKEYYFTGSHDAAIKALLEKQADIGCAKNTIYEKMAKEDPRVKKELQIIAESPDVPSNGLGVRNTIDDSIKTKLKKTLLDMDKDPEGQKVLEIFGSKNFVPTTADDYTSVFKLAEEAGIDILKYDYLNK
ncbi:MAG: phosphate/phosphite/phosphonate ABC transporter substrate-binding protein [Nitrospirae bacterium]|nr:phosphate/phosphite/phosphonate ABC transporter substrate-binding protein [Nitrospirota bacterium]